MSNQLISRLATDAVRHMQKMGVNKLHRIMLKHNFQYPLMNKGSFKAIEQIL